MGPENPLGQLQEYDDPSEKQTPELRHGLFKHGLLFELT